MTGEGDMSEEDRALAAEYVLGLMDDAIARAFEQRLTLEPALRDQVAAWENDFAALTDAIPEVAPPASVWANVSREVFGAPERSSLMSRFGFGQWVLGAMAAASLAFVVFQSGLFDPSLQPEFVAEVASDDASLGFRAEYDVETASLYLTRLNGAAAPGRSLEFWLIAGGDAPVSVIVWPNGAESERISLPAPMAASLPGATIAISDEPEGGSPTGAPTGAVLAAAEVRPI